METPIDIVYIILLVIFLLVCVSAVLFRKVLIEFLCDVFFSCIMLGYIFVEIFKDYLYRKKNVKVSASLIGEVAVVTGSRGIGFEVIRKLLESGAHVVIGCRDLRIGKKTVDDIRAAGVTSGDATCYLMDLSSLKSVESFATEVLANHPDIHLLINNAGVSESQRTLTEDGFERTFGVNYLGHCFLTHLLLPRLAGSAKARGTGTRIVHVGSVAHRFPLLGRMHFDDLSLSEGYHEYKAYSQSKLAQLMFTKTLAAKLQASNIPVSVFALHPGIVYTTIVSHSLLHKVASWAFPILLRTAEKGARTVFYACVSPELKGRNGVYMYNCTEDSTGKRSRCVEDQNKLWKTTLNLLGLQCFGGLKDETYSQTFVGNSKQSYKQTCII